jgi:septal ring factor EnvC (AmiA/AmiB activator)
MQIEEAKQHIEIFEMALRSKQCLGEQELEEYKLCQSIDTVLNELDKKDNYIETMHSELDRLEGIEDNTSMLKQELKEQKEANKELNKALIHFKAVINEMAEKLVEAHGWFYSEFDNYTKEDWKEYFSKKVQK